MQRRQPSHRCLVSVAVLATLLSCHVASAARSDGRTWWDEKRLAYPQCASFTNEHERLTDELDRISESARYAREPQRAAIVRQINTTAATRNRVQDELFACIRASGQPTQGPSESSGQPRRPPLKGAVEETDRPQPPADPQVPPAGRPAVPPGGQPWVPTGGQRPPGGGGTLVTPPGGEWFPPGGGAPGSLPNGRPGGTPGGGGGNPPNSGPVDNGPRNPRPVQPAADPGAYVQGFLEGFASCLGSALIGPIQQIWNDAGIYARLSAALLQGDSASAANILQIKGERDRRTFDAFVRSLNPNIYGVNARDAGRRDGSRLCGFGIIPGVVRAGGGRPGITPAVRNQPPAVIAGGVQALLADLSWLRNFNLSRCGTNCSNLAVTVDQTLGGKPVLPVPPGPALMPATIEMFYGRQFGARMLPDFVELTMRNRGDLKRAIIRGDSGPDTPGHQFNIITDGRRVRLLDGQVGREITWPELARAGYTQFQLLFTN